MFEGLSDDSSPKEQQRDHLSHVVGDPVVVLSGMSRQIALQTRSEALRRTKRV